MSDFVREDALVDAILASRRKYLSWWHRLLLQFLPGPAYQQVLREYDIFKADYESN